MELVHMEGKLELSVEQKCSIVFEIWRIAVCLLEQLAHMLFRATAKRTATHRRHGIALPRCACSRIILSIYSTSSQNNFARQLKTSDLPVEPG